MLASANSVAVKITTHGFPRSARLLTAAGYRAVFANPRRSSDRFFTVLSTPSHPQTPARLGLAIAKKQVRLATGRNRIKRLVRETFRHHRDRLSGHDFVVMARHAVVDTANARLVASLEKHLLGLVDSQPD